MNEQHVFNYARSRYLKWALLLSLGSILWYALDEPRYGPSGGTVLGYTLGTIGALLILWLLLFGIRKRSYLRGPGMLQGWLSAHIYLGLALLVVVSLHTGFQFGWNVHTLAYVLMLLVIASGMWGVAAYLRNPGLMSDLLQGRTLEQHVAVLDGLDGQSRRLAELLGPRYIELVEASARSVIARPGWRRLLGGPARCATAAAVDALRTDPFASKLKVRELYALQYRRLQSLRRLRSYLRLRAWTEVWLMVHVPLSLALLAALLAHILAVFTYW